MNDLEKQIRDALADNDGQIRAAKRLQGLWFNLVHESIEPKFERAAELLKPADTIGGQVEISSNKGSEISLYFFGDDGMRDELTYALRLTEIPLVNMVATMNVHGKKLLDQPLNIHTFSPALIDQHIGLFIRKALRQQLIHHP